MTAKILCAVEGCTRGTYPETAMRRYGTTNIWLICATHWRRLTRDEKRVVARLNRLSKKYGPLGARYRRIVQAIIRRAGMP